MRHYTECAGCYAAYPAVQVASGTLFQSRLNQGGQRTAPADKPQVVALPGKYLPIVEGVIDGAIKLNEIDGKTEGE